MINKCKSMARALADAITPMSLKDTSVQPVKVESRYDWASQETVLVGAKFGTNSNTSSQTCSGQCNFVDDCPTDSYTD